MCAGHGVTMDELPCCSVLESATTVGFHLGTTVGRDCIDKLPRRYVNYGCMNRMHCWGSAESSGGT